MSLSHPFKKGTPFPFLFWQLKSFTSSGHSSKFISDNKRISWCTYSDSALSNANLRGAFQTHGQGGCLCFINTCQCPMHPSCMVRPAAFARGPTIFVLASSRVLSKERSYLMLTRTSYVPPEGPHTPLLHKASVGVHVGLLESHFYKYCVY